MLTNSFGSQIWRGRQKMVKNEKFTLQDLRMTRKLKIMENEKHTLWDMEYDKNTEKRAN